MFRLVVGLVPLSAVLLMVGPASLIPSTSAESGGPSPAERSGQLISLDAKSLVLLEAGGKKVTYPVQPLMSLRRFGEPGAAASEFPAGEQIRVRLRDGVVAQVLDEISAQVERRQPFRVVSQDREHYRFTVEPIDGSTGAPKGEHLTFGYGKPTFLVQRENPEFVFRVAEGARLWINRGAGPEGSDLVAREVLDDVSRERFARQEELRALARLDAIGAPARVSTVGPVVTLQLGPDALGWAHRLKVGDRLQVSSPGKSLRSATLAGGPFDATGTLQVQGELAGLRAGEYVTVKPVREQVNFRRDVEPILQVNCLPCHGGRGASGFSISSPERLRAGGPRGKGIVPGKSSESLLYLTMSGDRNPRMPPDRDATREQLDLIKRWIDAGANEDPVPQ